MDVIALLFIALYAKLPVVWKQIHFSFSFHPASCLLEKKINLSFRFNPST